MLVLNHLFNLLSALSQDQSAIADVMLSEEKIFVVLTVVLIIWFGIIFFLFRTDKKITALEKRMNTSLFEQEKK